jgi:hypothetical protein
MASKRRGVVSVALAFPLIGVLACTTSPSSTTISDAGTIDSAIPAQQDTGAPEDSGVISTLDAAATCAPANVQGYIPQWTPPKKPQSACTAAQITSYGQCLDTGDPTSAPCAPWFGSAGADASESAVCKSCFADSKATDPAWGPIVDVGTSGSDRQLNVSGCMAIVLDDNGSGCAGSVQALQECESAACADNCEGASSAALSACTEQADGAGCANYLSPATCIYDAGAGALACFGPSNGTFGEKFAAVATVFCLETDGG